MKKIAISLLALAAVSTVALAGSESRNHPRDSDEYYGQSSNQMKAQTNSTEALAVGNDVQVWTVIEGGQSGSQDRQRSNR